VYSGLPRRCVICTLSLSGDTKVTLRTAAAETMAADNNFGIKWFERQVLKKRVKRSITDPLYVRQWHLHKVSNFVNVNAREAWSLNITGNGVTIAIVDDGLQYVHPDIAPNFVRNGSYNFNKDIADCAPSSTFYVSNEIND